VDTDLSITGKVAQFGRGALADVSDKLLLQFVDNLNVLIASGSGAAASAPAQPAPAQSAPAPTVRKIEHTEDVAPLDLLDAAGGTIAKRLVPVVIIVFAAVAAFLIFR
ncbi:MAG: hypothetical protein ACKOE7_10105, partial [Actinomycetota bacterium]